MDFVHSRGVDTIKELQYVFKDYDELMLVLSHLGDPRNAFLIYFPIVYSLHKPTGSVVLWLACLSEWLNAILKWALHGERPYWWVGASGFYGNNETVVQQYRLTCETGPGSPSGHAMVTAAVIFFIVSSAIQLLQPRSALRWLLWCGFCVFMAAACVSRCYIATHFPQQVLLGTGAGIGLTYLFRYIQVDRLKLGHYVVTSALIPTTCLAMFYSMKTLGLDPQWSISMATKYCARSEWIHLDTTPFNAIYRDAGSIIGFGLYLFLSSGLPSVEEPSMFVRLLHIIMSLVVCQVGENIKPVHVDPVLYYVFTYLKFCVLVLSVGFISRLYLKNTGVEGSEGKEKQA